ncbi:Gfo/Idh/MocA family protein [Mycolicibacterium sp.]|uniref:Gfo/Idh/MocA family protein n=1 Tax=Mycolicibacterium sp. TaxID=2320850 RepID=UPI00093D5166|nr:oxidoreductase [Mycobacterium sp. SWH-M3]
MSDNNIMRVALVGPGRIATAHLEAIAAAKSEAQLVAIAGLPQERERTEELALRYGAQRAVHDFDQILSADDIDGIVLTVPNHLHRELAVAILDSGKHVLVEKPLATTVAEVDEIAAAAAASGKTVMVGQCRRFFAGAQEAKQRMPTLNGPVSVVHNLGVYVEDAAVGWWRSAAQAGGLAVGLNGPHVIDTMVWLIGSQPVRVYAQTRRLRDRWEGEDEAVLLVEFADGSLGTGYLSLNTRIPVNDRLINGPDGSMRLTDDRNLWVGEDLVVSEQVVPYISGDSAFEQQFIEFVTAVREQRAPQSGLAEARTVVAVMQAVHDSQSSGVPVELDLGTPSVNK